MRSPLPKVLHEVGGKPMVMHILGLLARELPGTSVAVVVGFGREQVEAAVRASPVASQLDLHFVFQPQRRGTGDAASEAMKSAWGEAQLRAKHPILVLPGDQPLMTAELIRQAVEPLARTMALRLVTTELTDPTGYGRIVRRGKQGPVARIVEEKDANLREKEIREVGVSIYLFQSAFLAAGLRRLSNDNAQGEYYLTDLVEQAARMKRKIDVLRWHNSQDLMGVNTPWELAMAGRVLNERCLRAWALKGVRFVDPICTWVDTEVQLEAGVVVGQGAVLCGKTEVGAESVIGARVCLRNVKVGARVEVKAGTVAQDSVIEDGAAVGPYAHLRPESRVGAGAKIGNFVELKKARIGRKTSVAHLSYVGDAEVGDNVNIGCGFVTCNFDGRVIDGQRKHKTVIEDDVFLGSDCQAIAPVRIGRGAYVASGSTITEDVEADSLAIARARQVNKAGYARVLRGKKE